MTKEEIIAACADPDVLALMQKVNAQLTAEDLHEGGILSIYEQLVDGCKPANQYTAEELADELINLINDWVESGQTFLEGLNDYVNSWVNLYEGDSFA